jgi:hypothetical protein
MNRRALITLAGLALASAALLPSLAHAQSNSAAHEGQSGDSATPPAAQPAEQNSNSPATTPAIPATAPAANPAAPATPPATKKVWTNDDMGDVHNHSMISTFSGSSGKTANGKTTTGAKANGGKPYATQIKALQAKLPPLDEQISQLQAVLNGNTVSSTRHYSGTKIDDWHDELVQLQKQREDIATKISSLQDEARRNGVPENQIPE